MGPGMAVSLGAFSVNVGEEVLDSAMIKKSSEESLDSSILLDGF